MNFFADRRIHILLITLAGGIAAILTALVNQLTAGNFDVSAQWAWIIPVGAFVGQQVASYLQSLADDTAPAGQRAVLGVSGVEHKISNPDPAGPTAPKPGE